MRLLLLRHGQTHSNVSGALDTGHPGADLTDLGQAQARAAARVLAERDIDAIHVSTLTRTHQTAAPLAEALGLTPVVHEGIREIRAGDHEMKSDADSVKAYVDTVATWLLGDPSVRMSGGETGEEFLARFDEVVDQIRDSGHQLVVLVAHGAAIRTWVGNRAADDPRWGEQALKPLHNTGAIELESTDDGGWRVVAWTNDAIGGHYLDDEAAPDPTAG